MVCAMIQNKQSNSSITKSHQYHYGSLIVNVIHKLLHCQPSGGIPLEVNNFVISKCIKGLPYTLPEMKVGLCFYFKNLIKMYHNFTN